MDVADKFHVYNFDLAFFQCDATDFLWGMHDFIQQPGGAVEQQLLGCSKSSLVILK